MKFIFLSILAGASGVLAAHPSLRHEEGFLPHASMVDKVGPHQGQRKLSTCQESHSTLLMYNPGADPKPCMNEVTKTDFGCTAEDVKIAAVKIERLYRIVGGVEEDIMPDPITKEYDCSAGEDLLVDLELDLTSTATERYDIATWLSYEGADFAYIGNDCTVASYNVEALENIDILTRPVGKYDDNCGDVYGVSSPYSADVCGLPLKCLDASATSGGTVTVGACNTWKQNVKGKVCDQADRSTLLPGAPSKCKCEYLHFPINIRCGLSATCNLSPATHECVAVDGEPPTHSNVADVFTVTSDPDNTCDHEMTLASSDNGGAGCVADPHVITRSYELDDGNAWTDPVDPCEEAWTYVDTANPSLADPVAHGPYQCLKDVPTAQTLGATDDCDESPDVNYLGETKSPPNEDCTFTLTRTWEAKDSCGNTDTKTLDIQVDMTVAPTFTNCPQHKTVNICKDTYIPDASPTATDRCGNPATVSCNDCTWVAEGVLSRSWTATDDCDNEATCTQLVTFNMACT